MSPVAIATVAASVLALASIGWALWVLFDIGSDGLGAGPWVRPEHRQPNSRLPADFVGLWGLFGSRSIEVLAGSRESALRRLARLEASLRGLDPEHEATAFMSDTFDDGWLERRLDRLEALAGMTESVPDRAEAPPSSPSPPTVRGPS